MEANRFLYVPAVVAILVVAWQLVLPRAGAQGAATLVTVIDSVTEHPSHLAVDSTGRLFYLDGAAWQFLAQCPAGRPVDLRVAPYHGDNYVIGMENGDVCTFPVQVFPGLPVEFGYLGNVFDGTVQSGSQPWGAVKGEYRK